MLFQSSTIKQTIVTLRESRYDEADVGVLTFTFHVAAEEFLQTGGFDDVEALLSAEGGSFPVIRTADGVSDETFDAPRAPGVDHGDARHGTTALLSKQT